MPIAQSGEQRTIAYDIVGEGPDLVLLHGLCSFRERWHGFGYAEYFARTFRVIAMDFAGHGASAKPHDERAYALEAVLDDVRAVLNAAGAQSPTVLGFSYGGRLALHLSLQTPLRAVLALGSRFGPAMSAQRVSTVASEWKRIAAQREEGTFDPSAFAGEARIEAERNDPYALQACARAFGAWPNLSPAQIRTPTLFLVGDRDDERFDAFMQWRAEIERNPALRPAVLPGVDHAQTFFSPPSVLPQIDAFLSSLE